MTDYMKRIIARVVSRRVAEGEDIDDVLASYTKLTEAEKAEIKELVNG